MATVTLRGSQLKRTPGSVLVSIPNPSSQIAIETAEPLRKAEVAIYGCGLKIHNSAVSLGFLPTQNSQYYQQWAGAAAGIASELTSEVTTQSTEPTEKKEQSLQELLAEVDFYLNR